MFDFDKVEALYPQAGDLMWSPMLMWKLPSNKQYMFEEVCANGEYFGSLKKDGACYQLVKTQDYEYLFGRTVSRTTGLLTEKIANVPHIQEVAKSFPPRTVIVTEIYYPGKTSRNTTAIMGCLPDLAISRQKNNPIHAYCHDILYYDGVDLRNAGALDRYKILKAIWEKHNLGEQDFMELAEPIFDNIYEACMRALANGEEGLVLRKKTAPWTPDKRPAWDTIKMKKMDSADLVCTSLYDATVEYSGKLDLGENYCGTEAKQWPYWAVFKNIPMGESSTLSFVEMVPTDTQKVIRSPEFVTKPVTKGFYYGWKTAMGIGGLDENGKLVEVGTVSSGLTDEDCENMSKHPDDYIGHVFHFNCMEKSSKDRTMRHASLIGRREDKNANECLLQEEFK